MFNFNLQRGMFCRRQEENGKIAKGLAFIFIKSLAGQSEDIGTLINRSNRFLFSYFLIIISSSLIWILGGLGILGPVICVYLKILIYLSKRSLVLPRK
jgi:hypothetical protein